MDKLEYLKKKKDIIIKTIMICILLFITIKIFFNDKLIFISDLIKGNDIDYCIANTTYDKFDKYGKKISQEDAVININKLIEESEKSSYKQSGYMSTFGDNVHEKNYSMSYEYTYSKEQNAHMLKVYDYMYLSDDEDNNLIKNGTYIISVVDGIEYIFVENKDNKFKVKASENLELYNNILSFGMKAQLSKILEIKGRIKEAKNFKTAQRYIIDFDNFRSGISLYTYGNNKVLSYNISIYNNKYNYINNMSFNYINTKINIPK